jgi:DNA-binding LytR/AlgR family response regulator
VILETEYSSCEWCEIESVERHGVKVRRFQRAGYVRVGADEIIFVEDAPHYVTAIHHVKEWLATTTTIEAVPTAALAFGGVEGAK